MNNYIDTVGLEYTGVPSLSAGGGNGRLIVPPTWRHRLVSLVSRVTHLMQETIAVVSGYAQVSFANIVWAMRRMSTATRKQLLSLRANAKTGAGHGLNRECCRPILPNVHMSYCWPISAKSFASWFHGQICRCLRADTLVREPRFS